MNVTIHEPDVAVYIDEAMDDVVVHIGAYPMPHTTWFMSEARLNSLISNLLNAQLEFIKTKGANPEESAPKEGCNAEVS